MAAPTGNLPLLIRVTVTADQQRERGLQSGDAEHRRRFPNGPASGGRQ